MADPPSEPPRWRGAAEDSCWSVSSRSKGLGSLLASSHGSLAGEGCRAVGGKPREEEREGAAVSWKILGRGVSPSRTFPLSFGESRPGRALPPPRCGLLLGMCSAQRGFHPGRPVVPGASAPSVAEAFVLGPVWAKGLFSGGEGAFWQKTGPCQFRVSRCQPDPSCPKPAPLRPFSLLQNTELFAMIEKMQVSRASRRPEPVGV